MGTRFKDPKAWLYGLFSGVIGGGATGGSAFIGTLAAHSAGADVPILSVKQLGIVIASSAIISALAYLKQSPLPPVETTDTTFTTKP